VKDTKAVREDSSGSDSEMNETAQPVLKASHNKIIIFKNNYYYLSYIFI